MSVTHSNSNNFSVLGKFILNEDQTEDNNIQLNYNLLDIPLPSRTIQPVRISRDGEVGSIPGDTIINDETVSVRFLLDEELKTYFGLYDLQLMYQEQGNSSDIFFVQKLDNKHNIIAQFTYNKCWVSSISSIKYETQGDETVMYLDVELGFLDFEAESV